MTSFFPDLNVWLALSVADHPHAAQAWDWLNLLPRETRLIFSRYTQVGLLRLLSNSPVNQALTLRQAWGVYDTWLNDPRIAFHPEPRGLDSEFRTATARFAAQRSSKLVGDCFLLAFAKQSDATLVTFDKALLDLARKESHRAVLPA
jgi:uncharacterized protein